MTASARCLPVTLAALLLLAPLAPVPTVEASSTTVSVPSNGSAVTVTLAAGISRVDASGTYRISLDEGDFADAAYSFGPGYGDCNNVAGDNHDLVLRVDGGAWVSPWGACDAIGHGYSAFVACPASSCTLDFAIKDGVYGDNSGSLTATVTALGGTRLFVPATGETVTQTVYPGTYRVFGAGTYTFSTDAGDHGDAAYSFGPGYGDCNDLPGDNHDLLFNGASGWATPCTRGHVYEQASTFTCPSVLLVCPVTWQIHDDIYGDNAGGLDGYLVPV